MAATLSAAEQHPFVGLAIGEQDMIHRIAEGILADRNGVAPGTAEDALLLATIDHRVTRLGGAPLRRQIVAEHVASILDFAREK